MSETERAFVARRGEWARRLHAHERRPTRRTLRRLRAAHDRMIEPMMRLLESWGFRR